MWKQFFLEWLIVNSSTFCYLRESESWRPETKGEISLQTVAWILVLRKVMKSYCLWLWDTLLCWKSAVVKTQFYFPCPPVSPHTVCPLLARTLDQKLSESDAENNCFLFSFMKQKDSGLTIFCSFARFYLASQLALITFRWVSEVLKSKWKHMKCPTNTGTIWAWRRYWMARPVLF